MTNRNLGDLPPQEFDDLCSAIADVFARFGIAGRVARQIRAELDERYDHASTMLGLAYGMLNELAKQYQDDPDVIGFRVEGPTAYYEEQWNADARAPQRWRSGEWQLEPGRKGITPLFRSSKP